VESTQAAAINRAKQINNGGPVLGERVRNTDVGHLDKRRKP
jgi:DNA-directed RNA polymerase subunit K/omega